MKILRAILIVLFFGVLSWNTKLVREVGERQSMYRDSLSPDTGLLIKEVRSVSIIGDQQRAILMQRLLGLEHMHGMHPQSNVGMCPGCQQDQKRIKEGPSEVVKN